MIRKIAKSAKRDVLLLKIHHKNGLIHPTPQRAKGPGLFATYRIAYLQNKLLLLKAIPGGLGGRVEGETKQET